LRVLGIDTAADVIVDVATQLRFDLLLCEALIPGGCQQASDQFLNLGPTAPMATARTPGMPGTSAGAKRCPSVNDGFSKALAAAPSPSGTSVPTAGYSLIPPSKDNAMFRRKAASFRNAIDLKDKVQVKVLRKRLKLSEAQLMTAIRKSGNSITALVKESAN